VERFDFMITYVIAGQNKDPISLYFTDNYYLVAHLITGFNIIKPRNPYPCVSLNDFTNNIEYCKCTL